MIKHSVAIHIISSMARGGRERQLAIITKYSKSVCNRIIYYNECPEGYIDQYGLSNLSHHCTETSYWKRVFATYIHVKTVGADLIVSWGNMESTIAMIVSFLTRIPFINFSIRHGIRSNKLSHYIRTIILHLSKNIVANSYAGLRANNLRRGYVLYNGIEEYPRQPSESAGSVDLRAGYGINDDEIVIVSVANLVPYKDYFTVFSVLKAIQDEGYSFRYIVIGEGVLRSEYESYLKENNLQNYVLLLGRVTDPHRILQIADIFIHSSKGEGCSNAILEAMSMGLPVIASDTGGTSEIVGDNAILFPYKDKQALKEAMVKLIDDESLRQEMGQKSKSLFKDRFSLDRMLNEYHDIIAKVLVN